jgi:hypothetical protein
MVFYGLLSVLSSSTFFESFLKMPCARILFVVIAALHCACQRYRAMTRRLRKLVPPLLIFVRE